MDPNPKALALFIQGYEKILEGINITSACALK